MIKRQCIICNKQYEISSDTPGWASVWDLCPDCWLEDDTTVDEGKPRWVTDRKGNL